MMRVNKLIRLWLRGGRGVINAASTTTVSILLTFIIAPHRRELKHGCHPERSEGSALSSAGDPSLRSG